ncbi:MAG TPA: DUF177 domain-containing protein [Novosphingobium sp.]|nr:DUF177 domain-containing protein [Novosphingobium sp.]
MSEFSRLIDLRQLVLEPLHFEATEAERAALAKRFELVAILRLTADVTVEQDRNKVLAKGRLQADIVQSCAISGEDLPVRIAERLSLRFVPEGTGKRPDEEIELELDDLDEIEFSGTSIDLGEALAQSMALAIDPFAEGPDADRVRREVGLLDEGSAGPFAALAKLKKPN